MLACRNTDRRNRLSNSGVTEDVVRIGWFLDPKRFESGKLIHPLDRLRHIPDLVRVHHQRAFPSDLAADQLSPANIRLEILPDFHLEMRPALRDSFADQQSDL